MQNRVFGDDIRLEWVHCDALESGPWSLRVVTSQPAVRGRPATNDEIAQLFLTSQFVSVLLNGHACWLREEDGVICSDTHGGNVLIQEDGTPAAIDVPVMTLPDLPEAMRESMTRR
jgi:hypothetical protein